MIKIKHTTYLLGLAAVLSFIACNVTKKTTQKTGEKTVTATTNTNKDCPEDLLCTMDYRMINVQIKSANNQQTPLDEVRIFLTDNPRVNLKTLSTEDLQSSMEAGRYIIAEDGNMSQLMKSGSKITLVGYKDGIEKVKEHFVIGHDCCHVVLISGPKEIRY